MDGRVEADARIAERLQAVRAQIAAAAARAGRAPPALVAVSKGHDATAIRAAYAAGQRAFGENYVQELARKARELADLPDLRWHFIGHLQRNKVKDVLPHVARGGLLHTIDRAELGAEIAKRAQAPVEALIEVNAGEAQKSGCPFDAVESLAASLRAHAGIALAGLMIVPPWDDDAEVTRPHFRRLAELARSLATRGLLPAAPALSMGMSHDVEVAIEEGATIVRVGTAIFGPRPARVSDEAP